MVKLGQPEHGHNEQTTTGAPGAWEGEPGRISVRRYHYAVDSHVAGQGAITTMSGEGAGLHKNQPCEGNGGSKGSRQV